MMNIISFKRGASAILLDDPFFEARELGLVRLSTMNDGKYYACIEFPTIAGTKLEAKSEFNHDTPQAALSLSIERANEIRKAFK
jgi:hypothetical protein